MIHRHIIGLVLLFLICTQGIFSQEPEVLSLSPQDAVDLAVRNNLSLESARISLDTRRRKNELVWNQFLPSVTASGTLMRPNQGTTVPGMNIPGVITTPTTTYAPTWSMVGNFSASLNLSFALITAIETVKLDYQAGLINLEKARLQMERDVRKMYNQILLLEENVVLLRNSYTNAERQAAMAQANFQAGLAPRLSWLQAQVAVENLKPTINELENSLKTLYASFAMSLGLSFDTVFILEPLTEEDFSVPLDLAELISKAASGRPDILELQRNIAVLQSTRKAMAQQLYTPYLNFSWSYQPSLSDAFNNSWASGDNWTDRGSFSITLGINLNGLFPFTTQGQGLKDMDNNISALTIGLTQAIQGTELEIFNKVNSLENIQTSKEVQRAAVELAELTYNLTEEAYRAGLQDFQTVQSSALALQQARLQLLTQDFNYLNDLIDLEYAVGIPFGTLSTR